MCGLVKCVVEKNGFSQSMASNLYLPCSYYQIGGRLYCHQCRNINCSEKYYLKMNKYKDHMRLCHPKMHQQLKKIKQSEDWDDVELEEFFSEEEVARVAFVNRTFKIPPKNPNQKEKIVKKKCCCS